MMDYQLTLEYTLAPGWMKPYADGLFDGKAMARRCSDCQKISFPPTRICCRNPDGEWVALTGQATIDWHTDGMDGAFGLVTFDGADTRSVVRLESLTPNDTRGQLVAPKADTPQLILGKIRE